MLSGTALQIRGSATSSFSDSTRASDRYAAIFNLDSYLLRTQRNHHWVGGVEGQLKLRDLRVGVAGLGGMGSGVAEMLIRLGVGHLKIADPDIIDQSNINRQVIANRMTVNMKKVDASKNELRAIAEDFELVCYDQGITPENVTEFVSELDIVIDEIDVYPIAAHLALHKAARLRNLPIYSGYIIGLGSHIYKFFGKDYTIEDFFRHDAKNMASPTPEFLVDRYVNPPPNYMSTLPERQRFLEAMRDGGVPIFGASTSAAQSMVVIRAIADYLNLDQTLNTQRTPIMPKFIKIDPLDLTTEICEVANGGIL